MAGKRFRPFISLLLLLLMGMGLLPIPALARQSGRAASGTDANPPVQKELPPPGVPTENSIIPGQVHRYRVELKAGLAWRANVRRKGVTISLLMYDTKDQPLIEGDSASGIEGEVPLVFIPKENGTFLFSIESGGDPSAEKGYVLTIEAQREPTDDDRAVMLLNEGLLLKEQRNFKAAEETLGKAIESLRKSGNRPMLGQGLLSLSFTLLSLGRLQSGEVLLKEALSLFRELKFEDGQQSCLNNLSSVARFRQDLQAALDYALQSLELLRKEPVVTLQLGIALGNVGGIYLLMGDLAKSMEKSEEAVHVFQTIRNREFEARALANLGNNHRIAGNTRKAAEYLEQALEISRKIGNQGQVLTVLRLLGAVYLTNKDFGKAVEVTSEARELARKLGDRTSEAITNNNLGRALVDQGRPAEAIPLYREAISILRTTENKNNEVDYLTNLAAAERRTGDLENALKHIEEASAILDGIRAGLADSNSRAVFSGDAGLTYAVHFEILQARHATNPGQGYDLRALQISELARARTLVEQLSSRKTDLRQGVDRELLAKQAEAKKILDAKSQALGRAAKEPEKASALKAEVETALEAFRLATRKLDEASPRYARVIRPSPLSLSQMQDLIDSDTVLLEFGLGLDKSFLWVVTKSGLKTLEFPPSSDLQKIATQAYLALLARTEIIKFETPEKRTARLTEADKQFTESSKKLSDMFFGPIAADINGKRLIIVAEGPLLYLPFAALPFPGTNQPLVTQCEISQLPSISTLAAIRADAANRPAPTKTLAVLADPVFSSSDERVKGAPKAAPETVASDARLSLTDIDGPDRSWPPQRLPFTRKEAEIISALISPDQRRVLVDFTANRQAILSEDLGQYRFVHLATHGLANDRQPDLSGMVFSLVDPAGQPTDGFLHAYEVYNLKLPVDMVVLSGCRTGLGQEIRGEGLLGLTQAFLYAGASRVLVSLWDVQDQSTSILMADIYRGMLGPKKLRPSAALRQAQLKMMKNPRWASPFYWAAFTIQGEPR